MVIGVLVIEILLPGCQSLKEKRGRLKPLLARLHREFNISTAEVGLNDQWQRSLIACALVSNSKPHSERALQKVAGWIDTFWRDVTIVDEQIEIFN